MRQGKAEASGFYNRVTVEHLDTLRPLLLDGLLVAEHLLWCDDHAVLGGLITLKLWARQWS
jgi:hypothetical protein